VVGDPSDYSLLDPKVQSDPYPFYRAPQAKCPVYRLPENGMYLIAGYAGLNEAVRDPSRFSNFVEMAGVLQGDNACIFLDMLRERGWVHVPTLQRSNPPKHTRYRRIIDRAFNVKQVRNLQPRLEEVVQGLIDKFIDRGECDFIEEFAFPFPGTIIAELIGLSSNDWPRYKAWSLNLIGYSTRVLTPDELRRSAETELEMQHAFAAIFEERRKSPRDDLMTALVSAYEGEEPLTMHELQKVMHQLIAGGYETVPSALNHAVWHLICFPAAQAALRADRSLMRAFIDESLRFESPVQGLYRTAAQDTELGGTKIPAGSHCIVRFGAANRDAAQFAEPDRFDLFRDNGNQSVAFGAGVHVCPGAVLARQEMTAALNAILDRMDDLQLARPLPDPVHNPSLRFIPMRELRLKFTKRS
jgi:cytochrome P450